MTRTRMSSTGDALGRAGSALEHEAPERCRSTGVGEGAWRREGRRDDVERFLLQGDLYLDRSELRVEILAAERLGIALDRRASIAYQVEDGVAPGACPRCLERLPLRFIERLGRGTGPLVLEQCGGLRVVSRARCIVGALQRTVHLFVSGDDRLEPGVVSRIALGVLAA